MRILLISYFFPPYNVIGAVRAGKTAKYLHRHGHDVRVLTARDQPLGRSLPVELPEEHVIATRWLNINRPAELALGGRQRVAARGYVPRTRRPLLARAVRAGGHLYKSLLNVPDGQVGWVPFATRAGKRLIAGWRPDVIYASAWPVSSLLVAHRLARRCGVPWVAELRDLWSDNPTPHYGPLRLRLERAVERRVLSTASALVTVSEPLADVLRERYDVPTAVVLNGYDPDDFPPCSLKPGPLRIVYTGMVYAGKQDPTTLFQAIRRLPDPNAVRVEFYGRYVENVARWAEECGVAAQVEVHDPIPYQESLRAQCSADVLLLLPWQDTSQKGCYSGKIFEYLGARRPILAVGPTEDVAPAMIRERNAGVTSDDPDEIARALQEWLAAKRNGGIRDLPAQPVADLTRERQTEVLEGVLRQVVGRP